MQQTDKTMAHLRLLEESTTQKCDLEDIEKQWEEIEKHLLDFGKYGTPH